MASLPSDFRFSVDMDTPITVAVFGASGRSGLPLLDELLKRGHSVRAQARTPAKITVAHPALTVLQGDYTDAADVAAVVAGSDAVVTLVGHVEGTGPTMLATGMRHVVAAARQHGVERVVQLTGAGVPYERDVPGFADKAIRFIMKVAVGKMLADSVAATEVLRASGLDYTVVRGPRLTEAAPKGTLEIGYVGQINTSLTRADLAVFIVDVLEQGTYVRDEPAVSN